MTPRHRARYVLPNVIAVTWECHEPMTLFRGVPGDTVPHVTWQVNGKDFDVTVYQPHRFGDWLSDTEPLAAFEEWADRYIGEDCTCHERTCTCAGVRTCDREDHVTHCVTGDQS